MAVYDSRSGNTAATAEYVAEGARGTPGIEVRLVQDDDATLDDALWADGIAAARRIGKRLAQWVAVYVDGDRSQYPGPMKGRS